MRKLLDVDDNPAPWFLTRCSFFWAIAIPVAFVTSLYLMWVGEITLIRCMLTARSRGDMFKRFLITDKQRRGINRSRKAREGELFKEKSF